MSVYGSMITDIGEKELATRWVHKKATLTALANRIYLVQQQSVVGQIAKPKQLEYGLYTNGLF